MLSQFKTNFYIRKDDENTLWSGLSINTPDEKYSSYKLSCYISKQKDGWHPKNIEFIIFDDKNNMYRISNLKLSQIYNPNAKNKDILYTVNLSRIDDEYKSFENANIYLNELFIKSIIDDLKLKAEQSFGIKINI